MPESKNLAIIGTQEMLEETHEGGQLKLVGTYSYLHDEGFVLEYCRLYIDGVIKYNKAPFLKCKNLEEVGKRLKKILAKF